MNGIPLPQALAAPPEPIFYPCEDGEPLAETQVHADVIIDTASVLKTLYHERTDVFVGCDQFLYWEEGLPEERNAPDIMVVFGVEPIKLRDFFKIWEERAVPSVVFEMTSKSTADVDLGSKREVYQRIGVKEYFLFDPLHEYLERPLMGYRLINGLYEPLMPAKDGSLVSSELMLRLCPRDVHLDLFNFKTGELLPTLLEANRRLKNMAQEAESAKRRAEQAQREKLDSEHRAVEAERQLAELRAELARLGALPSRGNEPPAPGT